MLEEENVAEQAPTKADITTNTIRSPKKKKQYVALAQSPAYMEASDDIDEWVLCHCWIQSMNCASRQALPLSKIVDFLSDHTAQELGDPCMAWHSKNADMTTCDWLPIAKRPQQEAPQPQTCCPQHSKQRVTRLEWPRLQDNIPSDAKVTYGVWSVGDTVYYKHCGGKWNSGESVRKDDHSEYIPPLWLPGTILEVEPSGYFRIQVGYTPSYYSQSSQFTWEVRTLPDTLMGDFYMGQTWMLPKKFQAAQCALARNFKYLDYATARSGTVIQAKTTDGTTQQAAVVDWRDFDWEAYLEKEFKDDECHRKQPQPPFGAHVPIRWKHNQQVTLLSVQSIMESPLNHKTNIGQQHVIVDPFLELISIPEKERNKWERKALITSIESSGKSICHAQTKFGRGEKLMAFWPEDGEWYDVEALDPDTVSLETLASHAQFTIPGTYCPLLYEDGELALSPLHYVLKRPKGGRIQQFLSCCC